MAFVLDEKTATSIIPFNHKLAPLHVRNSLFSSIPDDTEQIYVLGIGSNRISGDSLGPFVGTILNGMFPKHLSIVGDLENPLDATNLSQIYQSSFPTKSFVLAVDSVIGPTNFKDSIVIQNSSFQPGKGLGHTFSPLGDCTIVGVVTKNDPFQSSSLVYANLNLIYTMALNIAKGIALFIRQYFKYPTNFPILPH